MTRSISRRDVPFSFATALRSGTRGCSGMKLLRPGRLLAQAVDRHGAVLLAAHDDVLQPIAEHRRDRALVLLRDVDHVGHHAEHAVGVLLGAHDGAHAAVEALVVRLDLLERLEARARLQQRPLELERLALPAPARFGQRAQLVGARLLRAGRRRQLAAQPLEVGAPRRQLRVDLGAPLLERGLLAAQLVELAGDLVARAAPAPSPRCALRPRA